MKPAYGFGHSQEDELTEAAALHLPGGAVLSITSAGEMPLNLLALGADRVLAVDIDPRQNHLARLKLAAALCLERETAIRFLGYQPAARADRRRCLGELLPRLPAATADFWSRHTNSVGNGPIWAGRFEQYLRIALKLAGPLVSRPFRSMTACESLEAQRIIFRKTLDRPVIHRIFRLVFSPALYGGRGIEQQALQHYDDAISLGERFFDDLRSLCESTPAKSNPFLQLFTLGEVLTPDIVPTYLTAAGIERVRERRAAIDFVDADVSAYLRDAAAGTFDKFHLSNVTDWMPSADFEILLKLIVARCRRPARAVWRAIHAGVALPASVANQIDVDYQLGARLRLRDRFPIYAIMPAVIR
jgi:S-adenosylmethionine-diacylglycerol 3-amino-3-carboxypropyl transferase